MNSTETLLPEGASALPTHTSKLNNTEICNKILVSENYNNNNAVDCITIQTKNKNRDRGRKHCADKKTKNVRGPDALTLSTNKSIL